VIAFLRGDYDKAIELLQESIKNNPERAASHFNLSQTYAKKLYFEKADQELSKANSLSFNRIRDALRHTEGDARQTMIDEPLPPLAFWKSALAGPRHMPGLPAWMSTWFAGSLWLLSPLAIIAFAFAHAMGRRLHQNLPSSGCTNCGRPICRRCVRRVRRETYCSHCGDVLLRIQSTSYSKLVLDSQIRRRRVASALYKITIWILPGLHAARMGRSTLSALLALLATVGILGYLQGTLPVSRLAWLENGPDPWWPEAPLALVALMMMISWITVVKLKTSSLTKQLSMEEEEPKQDAPFTEETGYAA
jgi:tetratricopeptide (TPR) repeat protein